MDALTCAALMFGGFAYATVGFGTALVASPFLIATLGPADGVRVTLILATLLGLIALPSARRSVRVPEALLMLAPAVILSWVFAQIVRGSSDGLLTAVAGSLTLASVCLLVGGLRSTRLMGRVGAVGAGTISAGMNVVAGIGGPPLALYTLNAAWPSDEARSTLQIVFLVQNVITLGSLGLTRAPMLFMVALPLGWLSGMLAAKHVPGNVLRVIALVVAGVGGTLAMGRGLTQLL